MIKLTCNTFLSSNDDFIIFFLQLTVIKIIKERMLKKARERYQSLSKGEKEKKVTIWPRVLQKST